MRQFIVLLFALAGCVESPTTGQIQSELGEHLLDYKAGVWDCAATYTTREEARVINHTASGVYTISRVSDGVLAGAYRETTPAGFAGGDFDDLWVIDPNTPAGPHDAGLAATYNATIGGGVGGPQSTMPTASIVSSGFVMPPAFAGSLGSDQFQGSLSFVDTKSDPAGFLGGDSAFVGFQGPTLSRQWSVESPVGSGSFAPYFRLRCIKRPG